MSFTNKIWIALFSVALAGFGIALFLAEPDKGVRAEDFKLKDIEKVIITNYPQEKEIILTDSLEFKPIIEQILLAKEVEIKNTKAGSIIYDFRILFRDSKKRTLILTDSPKEGVWFRHITTRYKSDSIVTVLNSFYDK